MDEAFGACNLSPGVDAVNGQHTSPLTLFARAPSGRIAPITDGDRGLLIGLGFSF